MRLGNPMVGSFLRRWIPGMAILAVALLCLSHPAVATAQEPAKPGFYDVKELERLIQIAREAGFTEEQIKEITIEAEGKVINAWEYLQEQKRKQKMGQAKEEQQALKKYLTVQDVFSDLRKKDEGDLRKLRDSSIFVE